MFLCCCVQTLRRDLEKGEHHSGWEDLLAIRYSGKQLWWTHRKGGDFLNLRCWRSLLGILHIFNVALGEVLWPKFCTRKEKGNVATDLCWIWIRTLVTVYKFPIWVEIFFSPHSFNLQTCTLGRGCPRKASKVEQTGGSVLPFPGLWFTGTPPCRLDLTPLQKHFEFPGQGTTYQ